jgi:inositol transport system permease protein
VAVIMVSSELPEILGMSDRVMVMHEGRITGILKKTKPTRKPFCRWHPIEAQRMSNMKLTAAPATKPLSSLICAPAAERYRHLMVMLVIALTFEIAGWYVRRPPLNTNRLVLIVLQVAIIGIIAVGVTRSLYHRH